MAGGPSVTVAIQTPAAQLELKEYFARWAYSGPLAAMLVPVFAFAPNVTTYCPFQLGPSSAAARGASDVTTQHNDAAAKVTSAVWRSPDIFPP
ncbi:hypothetical protein I545_2785 [Mycobacterium kansasii 662]|uniref:Uncharacterized protein n=1 Tax=Mycobacterium kansasii 662 TaxID=1299326 RepID=X7ZIS7_MYCKA|nr:hypothetical protein I545_2785 [Mycobacterium kansasii 662]